MQLCLGQTQNQSESTAANKISVTVNAVLVPVVVRDAHGNAVGDLKKGDFEVFDKNKKPQVIVGFDVQRRTSLPTDPTNTDTKTVGPNGSKPEPPRAIAPQRFIVFFLTTRT